MWLRKKKEKKNLKSLIRFDGGGLVIKSCPTLARPWTVACQAPLSMGFSRQEYWSWLPFSSPGDLSKPGIEPESPALRQILYWLSYSANNIYNDNRGGEKRKIQKKRSKGNYRTSQNIWIIHVLLESLLSVSFPSLGVTVHLNSLGCPPTLHWTLALLWGQLTFWSGPTPVCSCLQCPQLSELVHLLL